MKPNKQNGGKTRMRRNPERPHWTELANDLTVSAYYVYESWLI